MWRAGDCNSNFIVGEFLGVRVPAQLLAGRRSQYLARAVPGDMFDPGSAAGQREQQAARRHVPDLEITVLAGTSELFPFRMPAQRRRAAG